MYVNKRREPTTDAQVTRRPVRRPNFRAGGETWGVVRSLGEIASRFALEVTEVHRGVPVGVLAEIFRCRESSEAVARPSLQEIGCGIGHRSRIPQLGGVKQRKPGSHWGVVL
ncbi:hypothetical protein [Streptomyces sp. CdTB01]|uniref:hypothetical protein n=1 Tax=Streptomyces sp. CdTB01 TaxID=1725411 RepID=UPI000AA5FB3F|nr:hypothetical protein [Streptomyces sp. CdTB01]